MSDSGKKSGSIGCFGIIAILFVCGLGVEAWEALFGPTGVEFEGTTAYIEDSISGDVIAIMGTSGLEGYSHQLGQKVYSAAKHNDDLEQVVVRLFMQCEDRYGNASRTPSGEIVVDQLDDVRRYAGEDAYAASTDWSIKFTAGFEPCGQSLY